MKRPKKSDPGIDQEEIDREEIDYEMKAVLENSKEAWSRTQAVLKSELGNNRTLQWLSLPDRRRLTAFLVWEQRYKVSLEWMVEILLKHFQAKRLAKPSGRYYRNPGLPVRVATLVSLSSQEIIKREIDRHYPNQEHVSMWRERERRRQWREAQELGEIPKVKDCKPFYMYETLSEYNKAYAEYIEQVRESRYKFELMRKKGKPYRNSPWK